MGAKVGEFFFVCFEVVVRKSSLEKKMRIVFLCLSLVFFFFLQCFSHDFLRLPPSPYFFFKQLITVYLS